MPRCSVVIWRPSVILTLFLRACRRRRSVNSSMSFLCHCGKSGPFFSSSTSQFRVRYQLYVTFHVWKNLFPFFRSGVDPAFWFHSDDSDLHPARIRVHLYSSQIDIALDASPSTKIVRICNKLLRSVSAFHYRFARSQTTSFQRASGAGPVHPLSPKILLFSKKLLNDKIF